MSWANKDQYDIKTSEFLRDWDPQAVAFRTPVE